MANFSRVAEIFEQASVAFGRLAQLTIDLKQFQAQQNDGDSKTCGKWSQKEIDDLKAAISRFGADLSKIAEAVETKTINQIKQKLKTRAFQDAGLGDISFDNEAGDTQVKQETTAQNTVSVDRGRRKQALNQITESVDVRHPPKRRRSNDSDEDYAHCDDTTAEADNINTEKKFRRRANNENTTTPTPQNDATAANTTTTTTNNTNISSILKSKGLSGTLSSVLKNPLPPFTATTNTTSNTSASSNINSNVISFDGRHLMKTDRVGLTSSNYDPSESKYEDYDSEEDSDFGGNDDCTPPGDDYESNDEHDEEDEGGRV